MRVSVCVLKKLVQSLLNFEQGGDVKSVVPAGASHHCFGFIKLVSNLLKYEQDGGCEVCCSGWSHHRFLCKYKMKNRETGSKLLNLKLRVMVS